MGGEENLGLGEFNLGNESATNFIDAGGFFHTKDGQPAAQSSSGNAAAAMANQLFNETSGLRENIVERGENFLEGDFDASQSPLFAPAKRASEEQFQTANQQAMNTLPAGGALSEGLIGNIQNRATDQTNIQGSIAQQEYDKIFGLATGTPALSLSSLTSLSEGELNAQAIAQSGKNDKSAGLGAGAGSYIGSK